MRQHIILIISIIIIALVFFSYKLFMYKADYIDIQKYNKTYLDYNRNNLYGTDITSIINKAINNNEKYKIKKDESKEYIPNEENSIKIYVKFEENGSEYSMEKINKVGIQEFNSYFGELNFMCKNVKYHKNGQVSEMYFEATNY